MKRTVVIILVFLIVFSMAPAFADPQENNQSISPNNKLLEYTSGTDYKAYLDKFASEPEPGAAVQPVTIDVMQYASAVNVEAVKDFLGRSGLLTKSDSTIEYSVTVPEAGLYSIQIEYTSTNAGSSDPERALLLNGELPYKEAGALLFPRLWKSESTVIKQDPRGNDIRPFQITYPQWQTMLLHDSRGFYMEPLKFFFKKGINIISLNALRDEMIIGSITLLVAGKTPEYAQALAEWKQKGYKPADAGVQIIEGESAVHTNDPTLYPIDDRASPMVSPYKGSKICMNAIGGNNWKAPNQRISWSLHVEKAGMYQIALKCKQNISPGRISYRRILIDGDVPFAEVSVMSFRYSTKWRNYLLSDDNSEPFWFYLGPGDHEISLEPVLGELGEIIRQLEATVNELNSTYRDIIAITGTTPDAYRDYDLDTYLPEIMVVFKNQSEILAKMSQKLVDLTGSRSGESALIKNVSIQLGSFLNKPETIAKRISSFKSNLSGLGTLILTLGEQPLTVDYLMVGRLEGHMPRAEANFFEKAAHEARIFASSFTEDYESIGTTSDSKKAVKLWMVTGRDQAQVVKQMIDDSFTPQTGISVNLKLVQSGSLLPSVLSGINPNAAIQVGMADPVNYAMRGALVDLSRFEGFDDVSKRFMPSAMVPYKLGDGIYGLPETQSFLVMFYRKDILDDLGIALPQTWDDMIGVLSKLQKSNLEIGLPYSNVVNSGYGTLNGGMQTFIMFLAQKGGTLYRDGGHVSNLDSEVGIQAFTQWTLFYSNYKIPMTYDFANRFRLGEMPLAVVDYTAYNMLSVFAPEIRGLWGFTAVPGTRDKSGNINRSVPFVGTASVMFKNNNDNPEASWKFMEWWTSADTQQRYGREMENLQGAAARYPTANLEALSRLPWSVSELSILRSQQESVVGTPEVPGGYFTPRHVDNAFRSVVLKQPPESPREAILDYVRYINEELASKQREFGMK